MHTNRDVFIPVSEAGYELAYSISEPASVFTGSCLRLLSDTAPNTQLNGYGVLALIQVLTNTFFVH